MSNTENNTEVDFLDDLTPLSTALIGLPNQPPIAYINLPLGSFITIGSDSCFKKLVTLMYLELWAKSVKTCF